MLEVKNLSFSIARKEIIKDVSLNVVPGEFLIVIGSNGAGKSTLLNLLTGEHKPSTGEITLNEKRMETIPSNELAKIRAVLPQSSSLSFSFTVEEVVMMGRSPHKGAGYIKDRQCVQEALTIVDSWHLKDRMYTTLSGGESQRVQLARVIVQIWEKQDDRQHSDENKLKQARYLLLDEPTSALDLAHQHNTLKVAKKLAHEENIGVVAVLHDLNLAALYADKIAMMKHGKIIKMGSPDQVLQESLIQQVFDIQVKVIPHPIHQACPLVIAQAHQ